MTTDPTSRPLAAMDRQARLETTVAAIEASECDAMVVTKAVNIRWLSGFTGSNGVAVLSPSGLTIFTDGRYTTQIEQQLAESGVDATVEITRDLEPPLRRAVAGADRVALESHDVSWARQRQFETWLDGSQLVATEDLIETIRRTKDVGELDRLGRAAAIADAALRVVKPELVKGRSERFVARLLDQTMLELGADGLSFATIVAGGPNSAKPHAIPSDRTIEDGDLVIIDFGASVEGYGSDMTRSFVVGGSPSARQQEIFDAVLTAQAAGVAAVRAGVEASEIDRVCRSELVELGLAEAFVHGTGHGIGLEIHENPILSARATDILRSGYVVTVEPGVYLPDFGGVRIEDSVVVTELGCEPITMFDKNPLVSSN